MKKDYSRVKYFPISFFSIVLGLIGFTLAWLKMEETFALNFSVSMVLLVITGIIFAFTSFMYIKKIFLFRDEVKKEFDHPIKINFYPLLSKIFLISSIVFLSLNMFISKIFWWVGVVLQLVFTLIIMSAWIRHEKFQINHINPSWFIPVVGSILVPIAGLQHFSAELSWFFFSIGLIWWMVLFVLVINRMIFHNPIPDKLIPTMFILFAPPIIGFISMVKFFGEVTPFGKILYYFGLFMFILIMAQFKLFTKIKFFLSWWAYSFPLDALVIGTLVMFHETGLAFFGILTWFLFIALNIVIVFITIKTVKAIKKKHICIDEKD